MACSARLYPLRQPKNHRPPIPRWQLQLPAGVNRVHTAYLGVQRQSSDASTAKAGREAIQQLKAWMDTASDHKPSAVEPFTVIDGDDVRSCDVWACYWIDTNHYEKCIERLSLRKIHASLSSPGRKSVGIWCERFSTAASRLETNYSGLDYLPGLARLPGTETVEHTLSAYWGAARDRIPDSAHDRFERTDCSVSSYPVPTPKGLNQHLVGTSYDNLVHIRSGQFWENCDTEESRAYEEKLEPTLRDGLNYIWSHPEETGNAGLRYLRNGEADGRSSLDNKETCGAGFFRSLGELETWAERHKSHLAIYLGAIKHAKEFGAARKFRTWHEVSILKAGEASFEYVNCLPYTGAIQYCKMEVAGDLELGNDGDS
ncbi:heme-containing dehydratase protein [Xylogone sp. PMI_703]|nr:heme-containing dehydratase protein [Xylogone sp. PMI_703]